MRERRERPEHLWCRKERFERRWRIRKRSDSISTANRRDLIWNLRALTHSTVFRIWGHPNKIGRQDGRPQSRLWETCKSGFTCPIDEQASCWMPPVLIWYASRISQARGERGQPVRDSKIPHSKIWKPAELVYYFVARRHLFLFAYLLLSYFISVLRLQAHGTYLQFKWAKKFRSHIAQD